MARRNKEESTGGANWMDTYGDMVTLLLTFFVMLYASSSFDEEKWQYILQAFTSNGEVVNQIVADSDEDALDDSTDDNFVTPEKELKPGELPQTFDQLYHYLVYYSQKNGLSESLEIEKGKSNVYLRFKNNVFFSGDSAVLLSTGKQILDSIGRGIKAVDDKIYLVKVCGHTADSPTSVMDDNILASGRAVTVANYIRDKGITKPSKLVAAGYGSYRPVAPNDTEANRAKNRRVEIVIVRNDVDFTDDQVVQELMEMEFGTDQVTPDEFARDVN